MKFFYNIILLFLLTPGFSQVITNSGFVINISSGAVLNAGTLNNISGTVSNNGVCTLSSDFYNSAAFIGNGSYNIGGNWTNSGSFLQGTGMVSFNGSGTQNIGAATFKNVTFTGGNTKTITGNLDIAETINLGAGTTLTLSSNIFLRSTATATARVTSVPATASITYTTGKFIVERYIPGRRKYRLITSSVTTSESSTLSAGQEGLSIWGNWQNQGNTTAANSGTIITGGTNGDGFDQNTTNASLYTYDEINRKYIGYTSANGKNTKYTPLKAGTCYFMFVYGDRTNSVSTSTPNYTVLSSSGTIVTGDQTYNTSSAIPLTNTVGNYTMLGNPFASPIDWATITKTNVYNTYWGWDPNLSSTGGYVTVSTAGGVTLIAPFSGSVGLNQYIQSGQGFFVRTSGTSPSLIIKEGDKVSNYNANAFRTSTPNDISLMAVNLYYGNTLLDGTLSAFDKNFSNTVGKEDAEKIFGAAEGIAINSSNKLLSIDARQIPQQNDTIFLHTVKLSKPQYTLQIFTSKMQSSLVKPFLYDKYLNTWQTLSVNDTNRIAFNVTADAASGSTDRFKIVFSSSNIATPVVVISPASQLKVFPNPVRNYQINISINDLAKGEYKAILFNQQSQQIFSLDLFHTGGTLNQRIQLDKKISRGIYHLLITNNDVTLNKAILIE